MDVYAINYKTLHFGNGAAVAVASTANQAFQMLKTMGKFNGTPQEYQLISAVVVSCATIDTPTLVYEDIQGIRTIVGPKGEKGRDGGQYKPYSSKTKVWDYMYTLEYGDIDYNYAKDYFKKNSLDTLPSGCTAFVNEYGGISRNYDWFYDNTAEFIVKTYKSRTRKYDVMGVAGSLKGLTKEFVESNKDSDLYKILPFYLVDGVNSAGMSASVNLIPIVGQPTTGTTPTVETRETICATMLVRYILDNFDFPDFALDYINKYVSVYVPQGLIDMGYSAHYIITNASMYTYVLELINNQLVITNIVSNNIEPVITNFPIDGVVFNNDGTVDTQVTGNPVLNNHINMYGSGLERYNIVVNGLHSYTDSQKILGDTTYAKAYPSSLDTDSWYSEFVDADKGFSLNTSYQDPELIAYMQAARTAYVNRDRDNPQVWHSVHSVIYTSEGMYISAQGNRISEYLPSQKNEYLYIRLYDNRGGIVSNGDSYGAVQYGGNNSASYFGLAIGNDCNAIDKSFAGGDNSKANGTGCFAFGGDNIVSSEVYGYTVGLNNYVYGNVAGALGWNLTTTNNYEVALGRNNKSHYDSDSYPDMSQGSGQATQYSVGIGYYDEELGDYLRKNAIEIMQNGDVYIKGIGNYDGTTLKADGNNIKTLQDVIAELQANN